MESGSLSGLDNLSHLGFRDGVDMRPTLIRVLTDLYVQKLTHSYEEKRHYTELALRLLDSVDAATRLAVAQRLARHLSPPVRVMVRLGSDLPDIAALVRSHPVLQPKQEPAPAANPAPAPQRAVAPQRAPAAQAAPAARPAPATQPAPVARPAPAPRAAPAARGPDPIKPPAVPAPLAPPPPRREVPQRQAATAPDAIGADVASELNELFFAASADERRLILLNLHIAIPMPAGRVGLSKESIVIKRLETAALAHNREDFAAYLAQALRVTRAQARRIAGDDLGEPVVAAAKALAMPRDVLYRILLFVNPTIGHSVARVHALAALYDEMTLPAAEHMVTIWQALVRHERHERPVAPQHPLTRDEEARIRARNATETVRRAPAPRRTGERRDVS
jgi:uncharacterized protein (DUF2336 family)